MILDGTLLRIDRAGMTGGRDRPFYSGKQKRHGVNVQSEHGLLNALEQAGVRVIADSGYRGAGANVEVPHRRPARNPDTGECRRLLSANEKAVNTVHARLRGPGERANAQLKSWKIPQDPLQPTTDDPTRQRRPQRHPGKLTPVENAHY